MESQLLNSPCTTCGHILTWKSSMRQISTPAFWQRPCRAGSVEATCFRRALSTSVPMLAQLESSCRGRALPPSAFCLEKFDIANNSHIEYAEYLEDDSKNQLDSQWVFCCSTAREILQESS